jgi:hypothetical protein
MQHISSHRILYSIELWVKLLPTECTQSICINYSSRHDLLWSVLNPTHLIFMYLIRFVELARTMHQRLFLFIIFIFRRITQGLTIWNLDYPDDVFLHSRAGACVWVASAACYSWGHRLPARRIDVTGRSPTLTHTNISFGYFVASFFLLQISFWLSLMWNLIC